MEIYEKTEFGELLTRLIREKKMTQSFFFQKVGIGKAYFYDILAERISPSLEVQFKMLSILQPQKEDELKFFDLIAKAKNDDWNYREMSEVLGIHAHSFYNWLNGAFDLSDRKAR